MKAIVFTDYGSPDVLHLNEVAKPEPKDNEILVRVYATPVNYGDLTARNFANLTSSEFNMPAFLFLPARMSFGWNKPKTQILGSDLAGEVEAVGKDVRKFKPGDQVFAYMGEKMGANAEYVCIPESGTVALKPSNLSYEEASTLPYGAVMATSLLGKANIQPGQKVLIIGASGGIGSMAVQLARHYGAEVTGICGTPRMGFVKTLGADKVIDYTKEDFTQNGETYDLIFDILGRSSFPRLKRSLKPNGIYLLASFKSKAIIQMLRTSISGSKQKVICAFADEKSDSLVFIKELAEMGKVKTVIDRCFPLEQAAEAHRYVEQGNKQGNVVLSLRKGTPEVR
ncbi:MAG: NAD(P)-dependent alcohol dehydrogenase [Chloroflexi bacterium]|nr:MAG: NAD(P)-dependent alcohol dehydrogenase [Chloroflexota bacterium]